MNMADAIPLLLLGLIGGSVGVVAVFVWWVVRMKRRLAGLELPALRSAAYQSHYTRHGLHANLGGHHMRGRRSGHRAQHLHYCGSHRQTTSSHVTRSRRPGSSGSRRRWQN